MALFLPPSLLDGGPAAPVLGAAETIVRTAADVGRGPAATAPPVKSAGQIAEEILPLILRRIAEEREQLGDLTDPFA